MVVSCGSRSSPLDWLVSLQTSFRLLIMLCLPRLPNLLAESFVIRPSSFPLPGRLRHGITLSRSTPFTSLWCFLLAESPRLSS